MSSRSTLLRLIGPGDRKDASSRLAVAMGARRTESDQLHHVGIFERRVWNEALLEEEHRRLRQAREAWKADRSPMAPSRSRLVVDDTALPKKGSHSVGAAPQYASALGKTANWPGRWSSLTLARDEVPVLIGLRLFLPESWTGAPDSDGEGPRMPENWRGSRVTKPEIALAEIDRMAAPLASGLRQRWRIAGYRPSPRPFRQGLERARPEVGGLRIVPKQQKVYPIHVRLVFPIAGRGRPRKRHIPDAALRARRRRSRHREVATRQLA